MSDHRAARSGLRGLCLALVLLLALGSRARATEREAYYLLVFGAQRLPNNPDYSHSFATFVRAVWPDRGPPRLEAHTISWLPSNLCVRPLAPLPEDGVNLDLEQSLRLALGNDERVSMWGPFQICREVYLAAIARIGVLQSGQILYKAVDFGYPGDRVNNCIHAVSSVVDGHRLHIAPLCCGETASFRLVHVLTPWILDPHTIHPWVGKALGLGRYPIIYRLPDEHPRSGIFRAPLDRLLGGDSEVEASYGSPW
jgi:hypothetical protein